jgi:8-oxo-dGTP diphosphatase
MVEHGGRYLVTQRRRTAALPLMWEFPGGRVESGETDVEALRREVIHRLGVSVDVGALISFVSHPYAHYTVDLYLYECTLHSMSLVALHVQDFRWVRSSEFDSLTFTPADEASMAQLLGLPLHASGRPPRTPPAAS